MVMKPGDVNNYIMSQAVRYGAVRLRIPTVSLNCLLLVGFELPVVGAIDT